MPARLDFFSVWKLNEDDVIWWYLAIKNRWPNLRRRQWHNPRAPHRPWNRRWSPEWFFYFYQQSTVWVSVIVHMLIEVTQRCLNESETDVFVCVCLPAKTCLSPRAIFADDFWMSMAGGEQNTFCCIAIDAVISFTQSRAKFIADKSSIDNFFMMLTRNERSSNHDSS